MKLVQKQDEQLEKIRHSLAHILAMAVLEKFPKAKLGIGPTIENGFYYDFDADIKDKDLENIEKRIREIIKQDLKFEKEEISVNEAKKMFKNEKYKLELIKDLQKEKQKISIYKSGDFTDLCAGLHIDSAKEINLDAFKLTKVAGAYWRGSEKNPMLTRIYGLAFASKKELEDYLKLLEEAEKRDHRKLGKDLDLFSFHDEGPGFPFWHAKGMIIYSQLENFIRIENEKRGYQEIKTPPILNKKLWLASGHWDKFSEAMYFTKIDEQEFAVKPMNCPGGMLVYKEKIHSYKDLPLRYSEFGLVHRHELSGVLHGLFRVRSFTQDDAHSYCTPDQLNDEIIQMVDYALDIYKTFGFNEYEIFIATRPEKHIGDEKIWSRATKALENALKEKNIKYGIKEGEGAFYGPKIEFNIKDALSRNWQLGTIQVDFSMPERLGAAYIDKNGKKQFPVMVHRAILGSLERFIGILLEHYSGALPVWLSPVQAVIIPVSEKFNDYAHEVYSRIFANNIRVETSDESETLGKRIRSAELQKISYILVMGEKEMNSNSIAVRSRNGNEGVMEISKFISRLQKEIQGKL